MRRFLILMIVWICALSHTALAWRDLETGTFLTRDPIGYGDGPNVYCYVSCNPITMFDPLGLSKYDPETETLIPDEHLNIYEMDGGKTVGDGLIEEYDKGQWDDLLANAKGGYVTLPGGQKVKKESFENHLNGNNDILTDTAAGRSATDALEDGHMSHKEARKAEKEIKASYKGGDAGAVKTWAEHWNVRKALNRDGDLEELSKDANAGLFRNGLNSRITNRFTGEVWMRAIANKLHGPKADQGWVKAKGVDKWFTEGGREIVFSKAGIFEKRTQYAGTYNFGPKQSDWWDALPGAPHYDLDMAPWTERGKRSSPYE